MSRVNKKGALFASTWRRYEPDLSCEISTFGLNWGPSLPILSTLFHAEEDEEEERRPVAAVPFSTFAFRLWFVFLTFSQPCVAL
jgi:hypothetical protein